MRASILLFLGVLLVIPTGARAQTQLPGADVEDGYIEPGWFGASVDDVTWWPGRFAAEGSAFHARIEPAFRDRARDERGAP